MSRINKKNRFFVGICDIDLHIENCHSLKERRSVLLSLKEKIKNRMNVAICEFGDSDLWQRSQLAIVTCSNTKTVVESTLREVLEFIGHFPSVVVLNSESRVI